MIESSPATVERPCTGLVLTGGGARAAYQVGVLQALAQLRRDSGVIAGNPFPIITGTSAGAINAATLACQADDFDAAVDGLVYIWQNIHVDQVYRADSFGVIRTGARWITMMSLGWALARWKRSRPKSLLDNEPLGQLLKRWVRLERLDEMLEAGHMNALAISGSSYSSGQHVTFFQTLKEIAPWLRSQRIAVRTRLSIEHLLASSAIPFIFPAQQLDLEGQPEWFGDGSMRQSAPISPAIHLGAERILVIGAGRMHEPPGRRVQVAEAHPSMAQIAGHALSNIFLDALAVDIERMQRINNTLSLLPAEARANTALKPVEVMVIAPSRRIDDLAGKHHGELPQTMRTLLRSVGVSGEGTAAHGSALTSYLLFEPGFTEELITLGFTDTLARRSEVQAFFGWTGEPPPFDPRQQRKRTAGFAQARAAEVESGR
ncbi:patatin-like phospholipase family protein [Pelomonas sp. SE-A7]|uniref:patatin-like phospholipase family protein n=1 Tax=Pelomonas sp. SE-A7 TaxID=3054953 RepID=UPI00259D20B1|nr:patatin-like phospholipase family protein [Pelomonas sp. SE-A7]MDM4765556.1 patatin-like phospholipase family protein [Pelomonas sp. SE-A7]